MKKIILINHTFQLPRFYRRWQLFAEKYSDFDLTLIAPSNFKWDTQHSMIFGNDVTAEGNSLDIGNFHIITVPIKNRGALGWTSSSMCNEILRIRPDLVYHIGGHTQLSLVQCINTVRKHLPQTKMVAFSMRGPAMNIKFPEFRNSSMKKWLLGTMSCLLRSHNLKYLNKYCDAVLCHYPDAIKCFREEGFTKPIYISTQVGVNAEYYYPNQEWREEIRNKLNLEDAFVFGMAARFLPMKGLIEAIESMPNDGNWKLLLMGKGTPEFTQSLKDRIAKRKLTDKIILTGYVEWDEIAKYWNAIDCALHVPRTTEKWEETFSLAVVQAMACGKPIIGNTSGSVPYQIGPDGILVKEDNLEQLKISVIKLMNNPSEAKALGEKNYRYAINNFEIQHLNEHIYAIFNDILSNNYTESLVDIVQYKYE